MSVPRNQFIDPATGEVLTWELNHNTVEAAPRIRAVEHEHPTAAPWLQVEPVRTQGEIGPEVHRISGLACTEAQHQAFMRFWRICAERTIHFLPCTGGRYEIVVRAYEPTRQGVVRAPRGGGLHIWKYNLTMEIVQVIA